MRRISRSKQNKTVTFPSISLHSLHLLFAAPPSPYSSLSSWTISNHTDLQARPLILSFKQTILCWSLFFTFRLTPYDDCCSSFSKCAVRSHRSIGVTIFPVSKNIGIVWLTKSLDLKKFIFRESMDGICCPCRNRLCDRSQSCFRLMHLWYVRPAEHSATLSGHSPKNREKFRKDNYILASCCLSDMTI